VPEQAIVINLAQREGKTHIMATLIWRLAAVSSWARQLWGETFVAKNLTSSPSPEVRSWPSPRSIAVHTVARFLGVSNRTVRRVAQSGLIEGAKGRRLWSFTKASVEAFARKRHDEEWLERRIYLWAKAYPFDWSSF
jgi:excisionase family DNA binding protein